MIAAVDLFSVSICWAMIITGISTGSLVLGTAIAYMANGYPERREGLETVAGILLIGGLGLIGCALETVFGCP